MISVVDNFFDPWQLKLAINEVKKLPFYDVSDHPRHEQNTNYPGTRTDDLHRVHPLLATFIIQKVSAIDAGQFHSQRWDCKMCAHLRTEDEDELDFIHRDTGFDWAFLIYLSESNLKSGTKFYKTENSDKEDDNVFVKFEQNRIVLFDSTVPHMAYNNHGKDLNDGRLTINGFCNFYAGAI